ncbi:MAG: PorT family protein [Bacteroidales bacterium]|nr:PorT family protein [Bacteroidales bacterium]
MKKILLTVLAIAVSMSMMAQKNFRIGVEAGYDHGTYLMKGKNLFDGKDSQMVGFNGFHVGPTFQYNFNVLGGNQSLSLTAGIYYQYMRDDVMAIESNKERKELLKKFKEIKQELAKDGLKNIHLGEYDINHVIEIPVRVRYTYDINNDFKAYGFTGPVFDIYASRTLVQEEYYTYEGKRNGEKTVMNYADGSAKATAWDEGKKETMTEEGDKDHRILNSFDMAWGIGAGVEYKGISLSLSYDFGFLNHLNKDYIMSKEKVTINNGMLKIGVGYWF